MLTPPSRHLKVMQQNVAESKAVAEARREQEFSEKLVADRVNAVGCRRQQISNAHRERQAFLLHVRALFEMSPPMKGCVGHLPGPLQRVPLKPKPASFQVHSANSSKSGKGPEKAQGLWSEVSTAAPSTVGADDEICSKPEMDEISTTPSKHPKSNPWRSEQKDDSLAELEMALTEVHIDGQRTQREERDVLDLSSSDESVQEVRKKCPSGVKGNSQAKQPERCDSRSVDQSAPRSNPERTAAKYRKKRPMPSNACRGISKEEEALQKSLLRMDFEEMKRQFCGQKPLWRDNEVMGESFKTDPHRESKLEASLQRLDEQFHDLQVQQEVRLKRDEEIREGKPPCCRVATKRNARTRPRSSFGRAYSAQRRWRGETEVPTVHAGPRVQKQGAASKGAP